MGKLCYTFRLSFLTDDTALCLTLYPNNNSVNTTVFCYKILSDVTIRCMFQPESSSAEANWRSLMDMFSWKKSFADKSVLLLRSVMLYKQMHTYLPFVHSVEQKSIGLKFSKSRTGSDVRYICHHNSSRFTFPIFAHSCRFSVFHSLQSITPRIC